MFGILLAAGCVMMMTALGVLFGFFMLLIADVPFVSMFLLPEIYK